MSSPYKGLDARAFWRTGVAEASPLQPQDFYRPRFRLRRNTGIFTAGSCFAQHVGRTLKGAGFKVLDAEPLPADVPDEVAHRFGYRLYSARYGNVYTMRQFLQLLQEAQGNFTPADAIWEKDGKYFDAIRPSVEPEGLDSPESVREHRAGHLKAVLQALGQADVVVFTLGLTEAWVHKESGTVYPTAPGTLAGTFDAEAFVFHNFNAIEIFQDFRAVRKILRGINPKMRFVLTVSPVPLTATASGHHVQVASSYSKSTLRAVTGMAYDTFRDVDYFPSYELITSPSSRGIFFEPNQRSVTSQGVATAMGLFMGAHGAAGGQGGGKSGGNKGNAGKRMQGQGGKKKEIPSSKDDELVCEEAMLEVFSGST